MDSGSSGELPRRVPAAAGSVGMSDGDAAVTDVERLREEREKHLKIHQEKQARIKELQAQLRTEIAEDERAMSLAKALGNREKSIAPDPEPRAAPSAAARRPHQPLEPQVAALMVTSILDEGMTWTEAENVFKVSKATIARYVGIEKKSRSGEPLEEKLRQKRGRKAEITPEACVWLALEIERDSGIGLKKLKEGLEREFKIYVEKAAISKTLASLKITWKSTYSIPESWNTDEVLQKRSAFIAKMTDLLIRKREFIYIDEQGYDLHKMRKKKGHAPSGEPARVTLQPKGDRVSVIAALSRSGIIFHHTVRSLGPKKRGVDAKDFDYFLNKLVLQIRGKMQVIIFDNAKIHHAELLEPTIASLREHDHIDVYYLPPYSPFINAIEYAFNVMKSKVQTKDFHGTAQLEVAIKEAISEITAEHAGAFFDKAQSYWEQAKHRIPFRGPILDPISEDPESASQAVSQIAPAAAAATSAHA